MHPKMNPTIDTLGQLEMAVKYEGWDLNIANTTGVELTFINKILCAYTRELGCTVLHNYLLLLLQLNART